MLDLCTVCGSNEVVTRTLRHSDGTRTLCIRICERCAHAWRAEQRDFDKNVKIQVEHFDSATHVPRPAKWPSRLTLVAGRMRQLVPAGGRVLDIGCGGGELLHSLGDGWEKHGVEVSSVAADIARAFSGAKVFCGPYEQHDAEAGTFDLVTGLKLIEHLNDPHDLVRWAFGKLKKGGVIVVMTGDRDSRDAHVLGDDWPYYWIEEHVSFFSGRSLSHIVQNAGFAVVRQEWRYGGSLGGRSRVNRAVQKAREILGLIATPQHDHCYVYARKPG